MRLIIGIQPVREAIRAHGEKLGRVLVEEANAKTPQGSPQLDALARFAGDRHANVQRVSRAELDRASKGGRHQGAACYAPELALADLDDVARVPNALIVVLDELEDPQNFGAIVRSAVALGATAIVWPEHRSAPLSPAMFRASAGAVEHATLCRVSSLSSALSAMRAAGVAVVGLDASGGSPIADVELTNPTALVVGAEGKGLRKSVKALCDSLARLPMSGALDSLNASVAAAIAIYEAQRQRAVK
jgi:23S rRNA (guanosine2251-2'-O)-methyltransferase